VLELLRVATIPNIVQHLVQTKKKYFVIQKWYYKTHVLYVTSLAVQTDILYK